jgi:hypothetical protein
MLLQLLTAFALSDSSVARSGGLPTIWDASKPTPLAVQLPVRVLSPGGSVTRILAPDGSGLREVSLCASPWTPNAIPLWSDPDSTLPPHYGACGDLWFSRNGRLAVALERSLPDGPTPYVRPFDPDAGRFAAGESYRPESFWTWVLGDSQVACFVDEGRRQGSSALGDSGWRS